jgi:hypothetical protein
MNSHNFSLETLDDMLPWEREIYISLVSEHVKKENERMKKQKNG